MSSGERFHHSRVMDAVVKVQDTLWYTSRLVRKLTHCSSLSTLEADCGPEPGKVGGTETGDLVIE